MSEWINKIKTKWIKLRWQPIRVFVFHHVSDVRDPLVCQEPDWTQLDQFKRNIEHLKQHYTFISLSEACGKLRHDWFRCRRYAVLTTDDGLASVQNVIPWLEEIHIPLTMFVNTRYMECNKLKPIHRKWLHELAPDADEKDIANRMYLSREQIFNLTSPYIEIGLHGHEHLNAQQITESQFEEEINVCLNKMKDHPRFIRAYAYPWGHATVDSIKYLWQKRIVPLVLNGGTNYKYAWYLDRECIDNSII